MNRLSDHFLSWHEDRTVGAICFYDIFLFIKDCFFLRLNWLVEKIGKDPTIVHELFLIYKN